jgi:cytochrome P450
MPAPGGASPGSVPVVVSVSDMESVLSTCPTPAKRGFVGDLLRFRRAHLPTLLSAWHECGDLFRLRLGPVSPHFAVHPDSVQHVLLGNAKNYNKQTRGFIKLKLALGEGLLTSEGSFWRRQRRIIQPVFHKERLDSFGATMTSATASMLDRWDRRHRLHGPPGSLDVAEEMTALTLDIIGRNFAMMEAQLVLASIVQRYRLDLVPGHPVELEPLITLRSRRGMRMTATPVDKTLS